MDDIDILLEHEGRLNEMRIAATRARLSGEGAADCADCGEPIPAARREALPAATRCRDCQEDHERGGL
jgi:phage/conjugal plasmid C-4 type zinc finger TraR family protein